MQHPALAGRPYSGAIADFTDRAILAYECGYSEVDLREQLEHALLAGASGLTYAHARVGSYSQLRSHMSYWLLGPRARNMHLLKGRWALRSLMQHVSISPHAPGSALMKAG